MHDADAVAATPRQRQPHSEARAPDDPTHSGGTSASDDATHSGDASECDDATPSGDASVFDDATLSGDAGASAMRSDERPGSRLQSKVFP